MHILLGLLFDVALIAIIVTNVFKGKRHGFANSMVNLFGFIMLSILAFTVSNNLSYKIYDNIISDNVNESIVKKIDNSNAEEYAINFIDNSPDILYGTILDNDKEYYKNQVVSDIDNTSQEVAIALNTSIIRPISTAFIRVLIISIIIALGSFLLRLISKAFTSAFKFTPIGWVNSLLGIVYGLVSGAFYVIITVCGFTLVSTLCIMFFDFDYLYKILTNSYICSFLFNIVG